MVVRCLVAAALVTTLAACKRPSAESCEEALRNYAQLTYWEGAEREIAAAAPADREKLRAAKLVERDAEINRGLDFAVGQCRAAADFEGVKCMKAARTAAAARACREPWTKKK
ncbi:MAG: hypothetical protein R3B06_13195 [Kofleriaceae bacterium]